jgi:hypothetical protein
VAAVANAAPAAARHEHRAAIVANDNRRPAGTLANGTLVLKLRAALGNWRPEGPNDHPSPSKPLMADDRAVDLQARR